MAFMPQLTTLLVLGGTGYLAYNKLKANDQANLFHRNLAKLSDLCSDIRLYIHCYGDWRYERTFGEIITFREPAYLRLLHEAQELLGVSEASADFASIAKLREKNHDLREEITSLKQKRFLAPASSSNPLVMTRLKVDAKIAELEAEIFEHDSQINELEDKILKIFSSHSLNLKKEELDYFIISAEGNDLIRLMTIANNMKRIQQSVEKDLVADANNLELAKVYTGMYYISLEAYSLAHDTAFDNIKMYRKKLSLIKFTAESNCMEAQRLIQNTKDDDLPNIGSNLKLNKKTIDIVNLYDGLLERRLDNLKESQENVRHKVEIARNTYKTLENGSSLMSLINDSSNEYSLLMNFEMPELKSIYETGMLTAFMDITEKIKTA